MAVFLLNRLGSNFVRLAIDELGCLDFRVVLLASLLALLRARILVFPRL